MYIIAHNPVYRPAAEFAMTIIKYQHGLPHNEITSLCIKGCFARIFTDNSLTILVIVIQNVILVV